MLPIARPVEVPAFKWNVNYHIWSIQKEKYTVISTFRTNGFWAIQVPVWGPFPGRTVNTPGGTGDN